MSVTPGCSIAPQWPREEGCLFVQSAELNWKAVSINQPKAPSDSCIKQGSWWRHPRNAWMSSVSDSGLAGKFWNTGSLNSETAPRTKVVRLSDQQKPQLPPCTCIQPHPAAPPPRPRHLDQNVLWFSHPLGATDCRCSWQLSMEPVQHPLLPLTPHREFLTGVWAGRTFRAEVLTPTGSIFEGTPHEKM